MDSKPAIFIGGDNQDKGDWLTFDEDNSEACRTRPLCVVCGEELGHFKVFGDSDTGARGGWNGKRMFYPRRQTNGPPAHPRCFAMALKFCPHFNDARYKQARKVVAYLYEGEDSGVPQNNPEVFTFDYKVPASAVAMRRDEILAFAKQNPMGVERKAEQSKPTRLHERHG